MRCGKPSLSSWRKSSSFSSASSWSLRKLLTLAALCVFPLMPMVSCGTSKVLYVGIRPSILPSPGIPRLAEEKVKCAAPDGTIFTLDNAGGYYLIHESDLEVLLQLANKGNK